MTTETLASTLEGFLSGSSSAVVIEDGAEVLDLGQAKYSVSGEKQQVLAASLVARAECCPACAGCGKQGRDATGDRAADGAGASHETGHLPRARSADGFSQARSPRGIPAHFGAGAKSKISRPDARPDEYLDGFGAIIWANPCPRPAEARTVWVCGARGEAARTA